MNASIRRPMIEPLEQRTLLAATVNLVVEFYGLGGAGGFGNDWLDKIANKAGSATHSTVRRYDENQGGKALKDTLRSIDTNHNRRIDKSEVARLSLRVVGYSFGGIQAANFARDLFQVGKVVKGYTISRGIPVKAVVTLDPVASIIKPTDGVPGNVYRFGNYYQQKGGDTTVDVYTQLFDVKVTSITVPDPTNITGGPLVTKAHISRQLRIDQPPYSGQKVKHQVEPGFDGKIEGKNVNHGTVPFFAYDWALQDLTS